jgi:signal transduction histidine kinase
VSQLNSFFKSKTFNRVLRSFIITCFAVAAGFVIAGFSLHFLEAYLYDFRFRLRPPARVSKNIAIIMIDKKTVEAYNQVPSLVDHQRLLSKLSAKPPKALVYVHHIEKIKASPAEKAAFVEQAQKLPNLFEVTDDLTMRGVTSPLTLKGDLQKIRLLSGPPTVDKKSFAQDGVSRRMMYNYQDQLMIHPLLASLFNPDILTKESIRGLFPWIDSDQLYINFKPTGSFETLKFEDVLSDSFDAASLKDRLIIIGDDLQQDTKDYVQTPYSREISAMTLAELHANMFETLIENSAPIKSPDWLNIIFTVLISVLTVHVVLTLRPLAGILILGGTVLGFSIFSYIAFWPFGIWIDMAHPFLAIFLCYYFFIPYRLIIENRRSWEYYQKHKLLSEVETLKTNFIGMMSHDLKTPLARIQGMTDMISKDSSPLSSPQREALDTIKQSAEDLLKFISTILNYAKIESQGVELHLQAKDINQLLKEVCKKHEFLAKLKHIQLIQELEPLFSLQIDPELLKQVFSNLIENAIKYSPEDSKVLISSEEVNGKVIVQIADQGPGIPADELSNIFMKFFRSKAAKLSPIKGSGLGLYLAKYFVELHGGSIQCESTQGQGSTFTVELPVSLSKPI